MHWLFKSEPSAFSWDDLAAKGAPEEWDGVRNYQARNQMRQMVAGETGLFYHSQSEKAAVGIVRIAAEAHPDSTDVTGKWDCVDIEAVRAIAHIALTDIKAEPALADMALVKQSRLSVSPITPEEWAVLMRMAGETP